MMLTGPTIVAVIVNYGCAREAVTCAASVLASDRDDLGVVIVDNASPDDSRATLSRWVLAEAPDADSETLPDGAVLVSTDPTGSRLVAVLLLPKNDGYGAGNNRGIWLARGVGAEFVWILNPDTVVTAGAVDELEKLLLSHPDVGVAGAVLVSGTEPSLIDCVGGGRFSPVLTRHSYPGRGSPPTEARVEPVDYIAGSCMFCSMAALESVGGLAEDYFLFFEELDLARRLARTGYMTAVSTDAVVIHGRGLTSGSSADVRRRSKLAARFGTRSAMLFVRRFHRPALPAAVAVRCAYVAALALRRPSIAWATARGLVAGLRAPLEPQQPRAGPDSHREPLTSTRRRPQRTVRAASVSTKP